MKKIRFIVIIAIFIIIGAGQACASTPVTLTSGDFSLEVSRQLSDINKPTNYTVALNNKHNGQLISGAEIRLETYLPSKNDGSIKILKEVSPGIYIGDVVFNKYGEWQIIIMGRIDAERGYFPFRVTYFENIAPAESKIKDNPAQAPQQQYNEIKYPDELETDEVYSPVDDQKINNINVLVIFPIILLVVIILVFVPKLKK